MRRRWSNGSLIRDFIILSWFLLSELVPAVTPPPGRSCFSAVKAAEWVLSDVQASPWSSPVSVSGGARSHEGPLTTLTWDCGRGLQSVLIYNKRVFLFFCSEAYSGFVSSSFPPAELWSVYILVLSNSKNICDFLCFLLHQMMLIKQLFHLLQSVR